MKRGVFEKDGAILSSRTGRHVGRDATRDTRG